MNDEDDGSTQQSRFIAAVMELFISNAFHEHESERMRSIAWQTNRELSWQTVN